ncbi:hypothetical protein N4T20_15710 [Flavobacterium sp. TR2]|uniref:hypothetical protein n=1 Tax=Flavobacterium sp. TR2 TaxID=2977321 RepID=UPI0021B1543F|nr:hypothetical protein [Flavobacterium sp. TR2]UWY27169.1 hypothetical protein N4T20_15710 [Flavobacterium sp. TR2]
MKIELVENKKQSLYVYENDILLFYSTIDFKWTKKNIIKIFDDKDDLILEIEILQLPFKLQKIKILFQKTIEEKVIKDFTYDYILFNKNENLKRQKDDFFDLNQNYSYSLKGIKIAQTKQKMWNSPQKISLEINDQYLYYKNLIIIHILVMRTGFNSD